MIIGIGTDLIDMRRVERLFQRHEIAKRFIHKILSSAERDHVQHQRIPLTPSLCAKRFSVKESVSKALGCGIGKICKWHDISVFSHHSGQPYVNLSRGLTKKICRKWNITQMRIHLSISDEYPYAQSFVTVESVD